MKKKIGFLLLMLVAVMTMNVHAEGEAWPKEITQGDFKFTINDISLDLYEFPEDDDWVDISSETENGSVTGEASEAYIDYMNHTPVASYILPVDDFTMNPTITTGQLNGVDTLFINMNFNITADYIKETIDSNGTELVSSSMYVIDIVMNYTIDEYPENYKSIFENDHLRTVFTMFDPNYTDDPIDVDINNYIVLDKGIMGYDTTTNEFQIDLNPNPEEAGDQLLRTSFLSLFESETATREDAPQFIVMFHNLDNIEPLIAYYNQNDEPTIDDLPDNPITSIQIDEIVDIPNTGKSIPFLVYGISIVTILAGVITIIKVLKQPKKEV